MCVSVYRYLILYVLLIYYHWTHNQQHYMNEAYLIQVKFIVVKLFIILLYYPSNVCRICNGRNILSFIPVIRICLFCLCFLISIFQRTTNFKIVFYCLFSISLTSSLFLSFFFLAFVSLKCKYLKYLFCRQLIVGTYLFTLSVSAF